MTISTNLGLYTEKNRDKLKNDIDNIILKSVTVNDVTIYCEGRKLKILTGNNISIQKPKFKTEMDLICMIYHINLYK